MHIQLLEFLRCPRTGASLSLKEALMEGSRVREGILYSPEGFIYPIKDYIPRFVGDSNYADNFGLQWNLFSTTQLDSHTQLSISADRFWKATGWSTEELRGKWVLDCGCGAGRFAEIALNAGANVVAIDYSRAVDACQANLGLRDNLHLIQADIYCLPLTRGMFSFVYSLGVLQHTPKVREAFQALPPMLVKGGHICIDFYERNWKSVMHPKYLLRPVTRRMDQTKLLSLLKKWVPRLLRVNRALDRIPAVGAPLRRLVPVADYHGILPLSDSQLQEWAFLDTFDWLSPEYDNPQSPNTVRTWLEEAQLDNIAVLRAGHLVGRARKR